MSIPVAETLWLLLAAYVAAGGALALAFVTLGGLSVDPAARSMPWSIRLLLLPGLTLLWPLMALKWLRHRPRP